jgi:tetratricopeptide (TPR) repeat protein
VDDRLRSLWDFDDLDLSSERLHAQLDVEDSDAGRAEVMTQIARVAGLRGDFEQGDVWIDNAKRLAAGSDVTLARIDLERGRLRRSSGDREAALPHFESAFTVAVAAGQQFIAADAAHMAALAAPDRDAFVAWTQRGVELAEANEGARYWIGPLLNNLGWEYFEAGELDLALVAFERALAARLDDSDNGSAIALARYAVGKALRALDRTDEAIAQLELAVGWAERSGAPDGSYHEELAVTYGDAGRGEEAAEQARLALPLLETDDPSFAEDRARRARLDSLAAGERPTAPDG